MKTRRTTHCHQRAAAVRRCPKISICCGDGSNNNDNNGKKQVYRVMKIKDGSHFRVVNAADAFGSGRGYNEWWTKWTPIPCMIQVPAPQNPLNLYLRVGQTGNDGSNMYYNTVMCARAINTTIFFNNAVIIIVIILRFWYFILSTLYYVDVCKGHDIIFGFRP